MTTPSPSPAGPVTLSGLLAARPVRITLVLVVQALLVVVGCWAPLSARATGQEVLLRVQPVDPIDPFRGAYVALSYPDLPSPSPTSTDPPGRVYVPLQERGGVWVGGAATDRRPEQGPYLRCERTWELRCGIESYFLPEDKATAMERSLRDGTLTAVVRVDSRGNAALIRLQE